MARNPDGEEDNEARFTIEADTETCTVTLGRDFFHDIDRTNFDRRVHRVACAVRDALYLVAGDAGTRH